MHCQSMPITNTMQIRKALVTQLSMKQCKPEKHLHVLKNTRCLEPTTHSVLTVGPMHNHAASFLVPRPASSSTNLLSFPSWGLDVIHVDVTAFEFQFVCFANLLCCLPTLDRVKPECSNAHRFQMFLAHAAQATAPLRTSSTVRMKGLQDS